jgi:hypothetical protein
MSWETLVSHKVDIKTQQIDTDFAIVFSSEQGKKVLEYLESMTINATVSPQTPSSNLWHLEGQRYLLNLIKLRIKKGQNKK